MFERLGRIYSSRGRSDNGGMGLLSQGEIRKSQLMVAQ
jgi:hypothetical protein